MASMYKTAAAALLAFNVASGAVQAASAPTIESVADCVARSEPSDTAQCQMDKLSQTDQLEALKEAWRKVRSGEALTDTDQSSRSGVIIQDSPGAIVDDGQFSDGTGVIIENSPGAVVGHGNKRTVIINGKIVSPR